MSQLLKVLKTCSWSQNDRNSEIYLCTSFNFKLYNIPFSSYLRKTEISCDHSWKNHFFVIYAKTEGPTTKSCITSINKLDHSASFEHKQVQVSMTFTSRDRFSCHLMPFWASSPHLKIIPPFFLDSAPLNWPKTVEKLSAPQNAYKTLWPLY